MVNKTSQLVGQHGCWWAYEGELPPAEAFTTHRRSGHLPARERGADRLRKACHCSHPSNCSQDNFEQGQVVIGTTFLPVC